MTMDKNLTALLAEIDLRFKSGNSVAVERAYIKPQEWAIIRAAVAIAAQERK
jgi:hypothetical protein